MFAQLTPTFDPPSIEWWGLVPQMILLGMALSMLLVRSLPERQLPDGAYTGGTVAAAVAAFVVAFFLWLDVGDVDQFGLLGHRTTLGGAFAIDGFSLFFTMLTCIALVMTALIGHDYLGRNGIAAPEFHALLLSAATGAVVMAAANDLIVLFLALESLSIGLYVLVAMRLTRSASREAAMKYFVLGALASAFFLYGIALVYGATGTTSITGMNDFLSSNVLTQNELLLTGLALLVVGLGFKVAAAPFHMWAPDVYQGAPSPVTAFMASAAKAAGFAALLRMLLVGFNQFNVDWSTIIGALAVATLVVGTVMAVVQRDVKRMLAYSSISHAGYVLVGVEAAKSSGTGGPSALFYLLTYTVIVTGTFGVITLVGDQGRGRQDIDAYRNLSNRQPLLALAFTVFLLAQAGVPLTSGFMAKFVVIEASVDANTTYWLAAVAMLAAVVGAFMYLRIVLAMWVGDEDTTVEDPVRVPWPAGLAIAAAFAFTLLVGFLPEVLIDLTREAVPVL